MADNFAIIGPVLLRLGTLISSFMIVKPAWASAPIKFW